MIRPLASSMPLKVTTSPPTTMLITIPSVVVQWHIHKYQNLKTNIGVRKDSDEDLVLNRLTCALSKSPENLKKKKNEK